ncbi:MAG TPA: right-handed parallel beta-helix repeat-containing protein, partial [Casimicrobiaceae bacterium]
QSVSIIAPPGVYAGISVFSGVGITISAGSGKVTLRGLTINQLGGTTGIQVNSANTVYIDRVTISGFANGLVVSTAAPTTINILQSVFRDNTGSGATFTNSAGTLAVSIEGSVFERHNGSAASFANNTAGAIVSSLIAGGGSGIVLNPTSGTSKIEVRDSNINDNTSNGVFAAGTGAGTATASVVSSIVSGNGNGLLAQGAGNQIYVSDSTITRNTTGVVTLSSGTVVSGTDNRLVNNNTNGAFSSTVGKI